MLRFFAPISLLLAVSLGGAALGDVAVKPMVVEVDGGHRAGAADFEIEVDAFTDSQLEVRVMSQYQLEDGRFRLEEVEAESPREAVVTLPPDAKSKTLRKGEKWVLRGSYYFSRIDRRNPKNYVVAIRDVAKKTMKSPEGFLSRKNFLYAVVINPSGLTKRLRPSVRLGYGGVERRLDRVAVKVEVYNRSLAPLRAVGEALVRDARTNKLIETLPLTYKGGNASEKGAPQVTVSPRRSVVLEAKLDKARLPGEYKVAFKLYGTRDKFSASSAGNRLVVTGELLAERPLVVAEKFIPMSQLTKIGDAAASFQITNPNFFDVAIEVEGIKGPDGASVVAETAKTIKAGQTGIVKLTGKGYSLADGEEKKRLGELVVSYSGVGGKRGGKLTLPVDLYSGKSIEDYMQELKNMEKADAAGKVGAGKTGGKKAAPGAPTGPGKRDR